MALRRALFTLLAIVSLAGSPWATEPSQAETQPVGRLDVVSVSPWVDADGVWEVRFRPGSLPEGSTLTYSIRQPLTGSETAVRSELQRLVAGTSDGAALQGPKTVALSALAAPDGLLTLDLPIRSSSSSNDRAFLPNAGIHPIVITIDAADGTLEVRQVLFLNRLPIGAARTPMLIGLIAPLSSPVMFARDGSITIDAATRRSTEQLITLLGSVDSLPVSVAPSPELLVALAASPDPKDQTLLARLRSAVGNRNTIRAPWAPVHLESWATTGSLADLQASLLQGQDAVKNQLGVDVDGSTWPADPAVGPNAIQSLSEAGVKRIVLDPSRLAGSRQLGAESAFDKTFTVNGSKGASLQAIAIDPDVAELLRSSDNPAISVNAALSELLGPWFASGSGRRGAVLTLDETLPAPVLDAMVTALSAAGPSPIRVSAINDVFDGIDAYSTRTNGRSSPLVRTVTTPGGVTDVRAVSRGLDRLRSRFAAFSSTFATTDPSVTLVGRLMAEAQHEGLTTEQQNAYVTDAGARITGDLHKISVPKPRSLTVTARDASLPLRFTNELPRDAHVRLHLRSPRLEFETGQVKVLTLKPGTTRIDVPVRVQASGQFLLTVELRSADDSLVIATGRQSVRSTAFSGVGLILSGGALLVLVVWWIRTLRAKGAERSEGQHPGAEPAER